MDQGFNAKTLGCKSLKPCGYAGADEDGDSDDADDDLPDDDLARLDSSASSAEYWQGLLKEHWVKLQRVRIWGPLQGLPVLDPQPGPRSPLGVTPESLKAPASPGSQLWGIPGVSPSAARFSGAVWAPM